MAQADKDDLIYIEGNWYFPLSSVNKDMIKESDTQYHCPWKGDAKYYDVSDGETTASDAMFQYPNPKPSAKDVVKKDFSNHVAFWSGVQVEE